MQKFTIIEDNATRVKYLAVPYWLDMSEKWSLMAYYTEGEEPIFKEWGIGFNEYRDNCTVLGEFKTEKVYVVRGQVFFN